MPGKFETLSSEFTTHTGLDPKTNPDTFIQYVQARVLEDLLSQQITQITKMNELIAAVKSNI